MENKKLDLLHVVHRYGPVGGMERYVWELTRELQQLGHRVTILCEQCHAECPEGIEVIELGKLPTRPHWLAQMRFSRRVGRWLAENPRPGRLVHSHERTASHDVTTFHGHAFATIFQKNLLRLLSLRVWMRLYMEWRELSVARAVVANSDLTRDQLERYYPGQKHKLTEPVPPGVAIEVRREFQQVSEQGGVVGFVGTEWRRKGLPLAVQIVERLRRKRPNLELWVIGPQPRDVMHLFADWKGGYRLLGWRSDEDYFNDIDVLLHPASAEPYGMVISEAMAAKVPVVVSALCGAADHVAIGSGQTLDLTDTIEHWSDAVEVELSRKYKAPGFERSWQQVAREYEKIYLALV